MTQPISKGSQEETVLLQNSSEALYGNIECYNSFICLSKTNPLRPLCFKVCSSRKFEGLLLLMIVLNAVKLTWDTYLLEPSDSSAVQCSQAIDFFITAVFILEMLVKQPAMGSSDSRALTLRNFSEGNLSQARMQPLQAVPSSM
jgi:hypothetical protein